MEGAATVCRAAGCAILGGETAELPGIYREDEIDFCGTCVGVVERGQLIDGSRIEPGDAVLGFASAGIHANGFSLVRRIVGDAPSTPTCFSPADTVLPRRRSRAPGPRGRPGLAHVTGGGIAGTSGARSRKVSGRDRPASWDARPCSAGSLGTACPRTSSGVFNIGIGYCAVVPSDVTAGDLVIGRLEAGVEGVEWSDA